MFSHVYPSAGIDIINQGRRRCYNNYQGLSTMQKKSLDANIGVEDYSKKVFNKSMELIFNCRKIPIAEVSSFHRHEAIKKTYNAIEDKLQSMLKILRNFTETEKPAFNNPLDLAVDILEETKLQVEIQFRRNQQQQNVVKKQKKQQNLRPQRPQTKFPNIKPYEGFDQHTHQNYLDQGIIGQLPLCEQITPPSDIGLQVMYVDSLDKLNQAILQMKQHKQMAVDVEHSSKSYEGFTCLIQISTRAKDYIIDVFPIWQHVPALQQVIGNPKILKVMHGAEMDTKWLLRDFNIHIVNLFDTHKASRMLGMAKFSYAFLLNHYQSVITNKVYQRADWRQRPLSAEMLKYARMDTHYLLTIYDHLRTDIQKQAKSMNLSVAETFRDIQRSSHQVTLGNVQPTSYMSKEIYVILKGEFESKPEEFKAIQSIFYEINYAAVEQDECFDDMIAKKDLMEVISFIKDLVYNKKSKITKQARIEKIASILQRANLNNILASAIENIKAALINVFCNRNQQNVPAPNQPVKPVTPAAIQPIERLAQKQDSSDVPAFTRSKDEGLRFREYSCRSFGQGLSAGRKLVQFRPILSFISGKYGIEEVRGDQGEKVEEDEEGYEEEDSENEDVDAQGQQEKEGIIQFKRMNPNVIYTVEEPKDKQVVKALTHQQGRKVKKQSQFEERLKNKKGNIYDMLGMS